MVECVLRGERSLLMQFFIMVTPVEVCNHGPEGSGLHKQMKACILHPFSLGLGIEAMVTYIALYPVPIL